VEIRVAGIVKESIVDGPGIRFVVFAQGCKHNCPGCHNKHTHSFEGGHLLSIDDIINQMKSNPLLDGITLSGGEPFEQAEGFAVLAKRVKKLGHNVMIYTGYTYEEITKNKYKKKGWVELINCTDVLVDGKFEIKKKNMMLRFRGSENQRIIDVGQSMLAERVVQLSERM
jgi:anaerobic ribonucleoside-triphosphate reductase activating protein